MGQDAFRATRTCVPGKGCGFQLPFYFPQLRRVSVSLRLACSFVLRFTKYDHHHRAALRYAVHDSLVTAAFSGLFLLKMANLFPAELDLAAITTQVEQLAQLLSDVAAERYITLLLFLLLSFHINRPP